MDDLKTSTLSHTVVNSITVMTFNVPRTDNDNHDEAVGQIVNFAIRVGLVVYRVEGYDRSGFAMTFIQLRSPYADEEGVE